MSWRPPAAIRVKVLGLPILDGRLLAAEVYADDGRLTGVRPLGGSIEFGETREAALRREFREELEADIKMAGPWAVFENLFVHEGTPGHEIVFAAPIRILDRRFDAAEPVPFTDGVPCIARWFPLDALMRGEPALFPTGLRERLDAILNSGPRQSSRSRPAPRRSRSPFPRTLR
ncbi:NUDIX hydrolase [Aureimonas sp. SK2]|uniref:NUDIX hydrolase n=1 Tax=Aureimonas sp. SK2 TaxID=3015992 RepID=UPI002444F1C7|nr:NUDIX domain-containing protein [Aureimonas sp. SK2]